ncbi:hypothetical protein DJ030_00610 [bacterium endosymbiont of Escarpia laminata]|nr:MAG: hypothetical protein DJ031_03880 [bacterium endosymbiont of Escarpia laminata]RLJ22689.1 MAG: hypothetical protein DJ030_00610 [bacterium endosymbiont of Escarpia laminata]
MGDGTMAWTKAKFQQILDDAGINGEVVIAYQQGQDPLVKGFAQGEGICAGICYSFLRHDLLQPNGMQRSKGIQGGRSTASARFVQALLEAKIREGSGGKSFGEAIAPVMKRDGLSSRVVAKGSTDLFGLGATVAMAIDDLLTTSAPPHGTATLAVMSRIRKSTGGQHATAFTAVVPDGPILFLDPNLGKVRFTDAMDFGTFWEEKMEAIYATRGYDQYFLEVFS